MRTRVLMIQTYDQLEQGNRYNLTADLVEFLQAHGYAVVETIPAVIGPSETKPIGPTEIKKRKTKKNHAS